MTIDCVSCGAKNLDKNAKGLNKKLLGKDVKKFFCMDCLADYLGVTVDELNDKVEEFIAEGCTLFS